MSNETDSVLITMKEYLDLKEDSFWRQCVEAAGVDNWGGMDYAHELMGGEDDD